MCAEKKLLFLDRFSDRNLVDDVFLSTILDTDVAETQCDFLVHNHALCVSSSVHDIDLCDHTHRANALRIKRSGHLQTI